MGGSIWTSQGLSFCSSWGSHRGEFHLGLAGMQAERKKKKKYKWEEGERGEKKKERFSLPFFSHTPVFHSVLYPPAEVCHGMTRQPPWCEPDRNVASSRRHLISFPITFPKLAPRGSLGGGSAIDPSPLCVSLEQSSGHGASPQLSPAPHSSPASSSRGLWMTLGDG